MGQYLQYSLGYSYSYSLAYSNVDSKWENVSGYFLLAQRGNSLKGKEMERKRGKERGRWRVVQNWSAIENSSLNDERRMGKQGAGEVATAMGMRRAIVDRPNWSLWQHTHTHTRIHSSYGLCVIVNVALEALIAHTHTHTSVMVCVCVVCMPLKHCVWPTLEIVCQCDN